MKAILFPAHCTVALLVTASILVIDSLPGVGSATLHGHSFSRPAAATLPVHSRSAGGSADVSTGAAMDLSTYNGTGIQSGVGVGPANGVMGNLKKLAAAIGTAQQTQVPDSSAGSALGSAIKPQTSSVSSTRTCPNASTTGASGLKRFAAGVATPASVKKPTNPSTSNANACAPTGAQAGGLWSFLTGRRDTGIRNCDTGVVGLWLHNTGSIVRTIAYVVLPRTTHKQLGLMVKRIVHTILPEALQKEVFGTGYWASKGPSSPKLAWISKINVKLSALILGMVVQYTMRHVLVSLLRISIAVFELALAPVLGLVDVLQLLFWVARAVLGIMWSICGLLLLKVCRGVGISSAVMSDKAATKHESVEHAELVNAEIAGPSDVTPCEQTKAATKRRAPRAAARRAAVRADL